MGLLGLSLLVVAVGFIVFVLLPNYQKWKCKEERKEDAEMLRTVERQLPPGYAKFLREEKK